MTLTYVFGDIHGMLDPLASAVTWAVSDHQTGPCHFVFLGDYVDRGPASRAVLDLLMKVKEVEGEGFTATVLRGNHEDMMLKALRYRNKRMEETWLYNGGTQTIQNYYDPAKIKPGVITDPENFLDSAALERHLDFIETMPFWAEDEHRLYVHAGFPTWQGEIIPPETLPDRIAGAGELYDKDTLLWKRCNPGTEDYRKSPKLVVHGHTPVKEAIIVNNGLFLDTGACFPGGALTVAKFIDGEEITYKRFENEAI